MSDDFSSPFDKVRVPFPDASFATRAKNRLSEALIPGTGLGKLTAAVAWAGRVQGTHRPVPFKKIDGIIVSGSHAGQFATLDEDGHTEILVQLAQNAEVPLRFVDTEPVGAAETGPLLTKEQYVEALETGINAVDTSIDSGADAIMLAGIGPGTATAAVAVTAHLTRTSPVELSPRIHVPGGLIDDNAWMARVEAIRNAFTHAKNPPRNAMPALQLFGGFVIAVATGIIVQAALRQTPVLLDGPVASAASLTARDFSLGAPKWCYAVDRIPHPVVEKACAQTGMTDSIGPGLDIGEGCAALHAIPLMQDALRLAVQLPYPADDATTDVK